MFISSFLNKNNETDFKIKLNLIQLKYFIDVRRNKTSKFLFTIKALHKYTVCLKKWHITVFCHYFHNHYFDTIYTKVPSTVHGIHILCSFRSITFMLAVFDPIFVICADCAHNFTSKIFSTNTLRDFCCKNAQLLERFLLPLHQSLSWFPNDINSNALHARPLAHVKRNWNKTLKELWWNILDLFQSCFWPRLFQRFVSHVYEALKQNWNKTMSSVVGWKIKQICFSFVSVLF